MTTCRSCGAAITWERTAAGELTPVNADGSSHWATCPKAGEHRKAKAATKPKP